MQTHCLSRRKYTGNFSPQRVTITNKVIRQKSRCSTCVARKSRFEKQKHININLKLLIY